MPLREDPPRFGVLVSGHGSNLQAIIDATASGGIAGEVGVVLSNRPGVFALERASRSGIPAHAVSHRAFADRVEFERALLKELAAARVDWVVLAGFMRLLSPHFIAAYRQRIVNIHPSLLPAFPGVRAIEQAFDYGVRVTGCTVHLVDEGMDTGPILAQRAVPVGPQDTLESLSERMHEAEHSLYVEVLAAIAAGRLSSLRPGLQPGGAVQ